LDEEDDDEDDFWGDSSSSDSSSEVDLDPKRRGINRWLKSDKPEKESKEKKKAAAATSVGKQVRDVIAKEADDQSISESFDHISSVGGEAAAAATKENIAKKLSLVTEANFAEKIFEFVAERGKKKTDKMEQIQLLSGLKDMAKNPVHKIKAIVAVTSAQLDYSSGPSGYMNIDMWKS
jgi:translation initiation factor 3 subunit C